MCPKIKKNNNNNKKEKNPDLIKLLISHPHSLPNTYTLCLAYELQHLLHRSHKTTEKTGPLLIFLLYQNTKI